MYDNETKYLLKYTGISLNIKQPTSPISLKKILKHFPVQLRIEVLDKETDGMFIRSKKGNHIIINARRPYTRKRFSLGHEFGHYYLGHDSDISRTNDQNRYEEIQANKFSASLLMPGDLMQALHNEKLTIVEMAEWLRLSQISVAIRCLQLGIRQLEAELIKNDYYLQFGDLINEEFG